MHVFLDLETAWIIPSRRVQVLDRRQLDVARFCLRWMWQRIVMKSATGGGRASGAAAPSGFGGAVGGTAGERVRVASIPTSPLEHRRHRAATVQTH